MKRLDLFKIVKKTNKARLKFINSNIEITFNIEINTEQTTNSSTFNYCRESRITILHYFAFLSVLRVCL